MNKKIPFYLVTGFLGSGKTTFLNCFLKQHAPSKKIAIIQNEFAPLGIDGDVLRASGQPFYLAEMNHGSVFCVCQFSGFKDLLLKLSEEQKPDIILVETTGIADPIGIAQLLSEQSLHDIFFLAHVFTLIDSSRFLAVLKSLSCVKHQILIADTVLVNKSDLIPSDNIKETIRTEIKQINPFANLLFIKNGEVDTAQIVNSFFHTIPMVEKNHIQGELTRCGQGGYVSDVFKSTKPINHEKWINFLNQLSPDIYRIKGYAFFDDGHSYMIQYIPGQIDTQMIDKSGQLTELIAIGNDKPNFSLLDD
ncbi:MAG: CobW family GTP-binding protein [Bacteroidaceae bacterium]|nr:GTP-binding protein [Bacteroidaceae bacterium]